MTKLPTKPVPRGLTIVGSRPIPWLDGGVVTLATAPLSAVRTVTYDHGRFVIVAEMLSKRVPYQYTPKVGDTLTALVRADQGSIDLFDVEIVP